MKAILAGAGTGGTIYKDFTPFSVKEIRQHFGLYVLQGLVLSPRIEMKFKPQRVDPVAGNDFYHQSFGTNAERRHRHFKTFLALQNPSIHAPSQSEYPNWKVQPSLKCMLSLFPTI